MYIVEKTIKNQKYSNKDYYENNNRKKTYIY